MTTTTYYGVPRARLAPLNTAEIEQREADRYAVREALKAACAKATPITHRRIPRLFHTCHDGVRIYI